MARLMIKVVSRKAERLLSIFELYCVANFIISPSVRMDFKHITCRVFGKICGPPGFGDDLIHNLHGRIDPDDGQVKGNENHMDGGVDARITRADEEQAFIQSERGTKGQAAQLGEEGVAI